MVALALLAGVSSPARAQFAVFDVSNYTQNLLQAARALEQVNNQIQSLQNEAQMLQNQARNLTSLDVSSLDRLNRSVSAITTAMNQAQGVLFNQASVDQAFARFYPRGIDGTTSGAQMLLDAKTRWQNSVDGLQQTMQVQNEIVAGLGNDQTEMTRLVGASQGAVGHLQATQAGNQLVALQVSQLARLQSLLAAQARSQALEAARKTAAEEQGREQLKRFLGDAPTYTPAPVQMFHD